MTYQLAKFSGAFLLIFCVALLGCGGGDPPSSGDSSSSSGDDGSSSSDGSPTTDDGASDDGAADDGSEEVSTEGWGHLKGKFLVKGAPAAKKIEVAGNDAAYCGKFDLHEEEVVVGDNGELANVVLTLNIGRGDEPPTPHESYAADAEAAVLMDNKDCRFEPHITLLRTSQTLDIKNSDTVGHNTKIDPPNNTAINPIIPPGQTLEGNKFEKAERLPVGTSCSIHTYMKGWLVISESPYMAVSDESGEFLIENLPAGKHTFTVWQEKAGYLSDVEVGGKATEWSRGRVEVIIKDGETTDLGDVTVEYAKLEG